jgi:hypothetical protein
MNALSGDVVAASVSPARAALAKARLRREEIDGEFRAAVERQQRVEQLVAAPGPVAAEIKRLDGEHAELIAEWAARGDGSPAPKLPHTKEIAALQARLKEAEVIAGAARAAMPKLAGDVAACQDDAARCVESMGRHASDALLEEAHVLAAVLVATELRAAAIRLSLVGLQRHFELAGMRGDRDAGPRENAARRLIPLPPGLPSPEEIQAVVANWGAFAGRLIVDENARLED